MESGHAILTCLFSNYKQQLKRKFVQYGLIIKVHEFVSFNINVVTCQLALFCMGVKLGR
jgi:hypothetical protein